MSLIGSVTAPISPPPPPPPPPPSNESTQTDSVNESENQDSTQTVSETEESGESQTSSDTQSGGDSPSDTQSNNQTAVSTSSDESSASNSPVSESVSQFIVAAPAANSQDTQVDALQTGEIQEVGVAADVEISNAELREAAKNPTGEFSSKLDITSLFEPAPPLTEQIEASDTSQNDIIKSYYDIANSQSETQQLVDEAF